MQSHMMARNIKLENIWLFLSTLSLGNSSTSKNNNTKWIREELHVFFTPSSRGSFNRRISCSPPTNVARGFESWHWRHMLVEFVVGFLPCSERFFSGYFDSVSPLLKTNTFNSNSIWNARTRFHEFLRNPKCSVEAGDLCYKKDQPNFVIHWKEIYPVDSAIHRLSNCCLVFKCFTFFSKKPLSGIATRVWML